MVQGHGAVLLLQVGSTVLCLGDSRQNNEGATLEIRLFAPLAEKRITIKWRGLTKRAFDGAKRCPECGEGVVGFLGPCEMCGYNPPRK